MRVLFILSCLVMVYGDVVVPKWKAPLPLAPLVKDVLPLPPLPPLLKGGLPLPTDKVLLPPLAKHPLPWVPLPPVSKLGVPLPLPWAPLPSPWLPLSKHPLSWGKLPLIPLKHSLPYSPKVMGLCNSLGFAPDLKNLSIFYRCTLWGKLLRVYKFNCPAGTIFNPVLNVCVWVKKL